jgi:hypothetical protein
MARVAEYISSHMKIVKTFVKIGRMPLSVMNDYDIYLFYKSIDYEPAQMRRYQIVASNFKCSVDTVRRAVVGMQKNINP